MAKNIPKTNNNNENINQESDYKLIDGLDQKLIELLLKGYSNKKIALEAKSPLSTIQRRIRRIFEDQYLHKKNELNYKKLGLRKGYLLISLRGDYADLVAQKVSTIKGITCVSLVTGNIDIMSTCLFRETADLFNIIESIKTNERVDKVSWAEEVHDIPSKEITVLSSLVKESINTSIEENNTNDSTHKETAP
jgi:DNA-binding Lrp family transcriptional regulator